MLKKFFSLVLMCILTLSLVSCTKAAKNDTEVATPPDLKIRTGAYDLNFIAMHNSVIDYITEEHMPFFFIKENEFDISGDNEKRFIRLTCNCLEGTTIEDLDLFLSMALNGIGLNAAEQDYRFKAPNVGNDGSYIDFGTVFNVYELQINATVEDGTTLRNNVIAPGQQIPVDPRYIME